MNHFFAKDTSKTFFSVWTFSETEINNFIDFALRFHSTPLLYSRMNCRQKKLFSSILRFFKGPRFIDSKIRDVYTYYKLTEMFQ